MPMGEMIKLMITRLEWFETRYTKRPLLVAQQQ